MTTRILGTVALCLCMSQLAVAKDPPALYGLTHIRNDSTAKATTFYKWGNGPWKKVVIEQGKMMAFAWAYDGTSKHSPDLFIRIDVDTESGARYVEHIVSRAQSPDDNSAKYGHQFAIKQVQGTNNRYIDAVTAGAKVKVTDANSSRPEVK
jgi:hypothetical protein